MKASNRKLDRSILIGAIIFALISIGFVVTSVLGFGKQFAESEVVDDPGRGQAILVALEESVGYTRLMSEAQDLAVAPVQWNFYEAAGRERGFLVSTNLVYKRTGPGQGEIFDMDKEQPQLRPTIPNWYLVKYGLAYEYQNVGELDQDLDFFTNEEEYQYSSMYGEEFDPTDAESHPPYYLKLNYSEFVSESYMLDFSSGSDPYMLRHAPKVGQEGRWTAFAEKGVEFGARTGEDVGRFIIREVEQVQVEVPGGVRNVPQLLIEDLHRQPETHRLRTFSLAQGNEIDLETRLAVFSFVAGGGSFRVEEFESFTLPEVGGPEFLLEEVTPENVTISFEDEDGVRHSLEINLQGYPEPHVK